jgi:hypothetical protein
MYSSRRFNPTKLQSLTVEWYYTVACLAGPYISSDAQLINVTFVMYNLSFLHCPEYGGSMFL